MNTFMLMAASSSALNTNMHFKISIITNDIRTACHAHRKCINRYLNSKMTMRSKQ